MELTFIGEIWYWRGPAPFYFVTVPAGEGRQLHEVSRLVTYGWGMIPVVARIGETSWETSLFPKDGSYMLPIKVAVGRAEDVEDGDTVAVQLTVVEPA